jgi:hypothetical protein
MDEPRRKICSEISDYTLGNRGSSKRAETAREIKSNRVFPVSLPLRDSSESAMPPVQQRLTVIDNF